MTSWVGKIESIRGNNNRKEIVLYLKNWRMSELDVNLPSTRYIQTLIKDKTRVEIKLLTTDVSIGTIIWQDPDCLFLTDANAQKMSIYRHAIAFIKPL